MKRFVCIALILACSSTGANSTVTTFTSSAAFYAANPNATLIEDFEDSDLAVQHAALTTYMGPGGEITFTAISSYPFAANLYLTTPGFMSYGPGLNPMDSVVLAATGNEEWLGTLTSPTYALGFDVFLNPWPLTITFFSGSTVLATLNYDSPPTSGDYHAFAGINSTQPITSFHWEATNGEYVDTGIDNIVVGPAPSVPEPSTWAMMLFGFGAVGAWVRRSRRQVLSQLA